jgi:hypothetical protein
MVRISETSSAACILFKELERYGGQTVSRSNQDTEIADETRSDPPEIDRNIVKNNTRL